MRPPLVRLALALSLAVCAASGPASAAAVNIFDLPLGVRCVPDDLAGMICVEVPQPWYRGRWVSYAVVAAAAVTLAGAGIVTARARRADRPGRLAFPVCLGAWLLAAVASPRRPYRVTAPGHLDPSRFGSKSFRHAMEQTTIWRGQV